MKEIWNRKGDDELDEMKRNKGGLEKEREKIEEQRRKKERQFRGGRIVKKTNGNKRKFCLKRFCNKKWGKGEVSEVLLNIYKMYKKVWMKEWLRKL